MVIHSANEIQELHDELHKTRKELTKALRAIRHIADNLSDASECKNKHKRNEYINNARNIAFKFEVENG